VLLSSEEQKKKHPVTAVGDMLLFNRAIMYTTYIK